LKNRFVTTSIWVSQRSGQSGLTKDQVFSIQFLGKGVIIVDMVLLPKLAQREKWRRTSKADSGLALRELLATTAGQKIVISRNFFPR
jgi:hypothetical protein